MTPMPQNPKVVLLVTKAGITAHASNIDPALDVVVTDDPSVFYLASLGVTFNSTAEVQAPQVLAMRKK